MLRIIQPNAPLLVKRNAQQRIAADGARSLFVKRHQWLAPPLNAVRWAATPFTYTEIQYNMFPQMIPQIDDASVTWQRFLEKAQRGSYKAADMLKYAEYAITTEVMGQRYFEVSPAEEYSVLLHRLFPTTPPLPTVQGFLNQLIHARYLLQPAQAQSIAFHEYDVYQDIWQRERFVPALELVHDATLYCFHHWSAAEYEHLTARIEETNPYYNAQDVVAAMLMLLSTGVISSASSHVHVS